MISENLTWEAMVAAIGQETALKFVGAFGGIPVYIPKQAKAGQKIARVIGLPAATELAKLWGGGTYDVPMAKGAVRHEILAEVAAGRLNKMRAARILGLSLRSVRRLVNGQSDPRQQSLF